MHCHSGHRPHHSLRWPRLASPFDFAVAHGGSLPGLWRSDRASTPSWSRRRSRSSRFCSTWLTPACTAASRTRSLRATRPRPGRQTPRQVQPLNKLDLSRRLLTFLQSHHAFQFRPGSSGLCLPCEERRSVYPGLVQYTSGNRTTSKTTVMVCVLRTENVFCFSPLCPFPRMRGLAGGRARGRGEFGGQVPRCRFWWLYLGPNSMHQCQSPTP